MSTTASVAVPATAKIANPPASGEVRRVREVLDHRPRDECTGGGAGHRRDRVGDRPPRTVEVDEPGADGPDRAARRDTLEDAGDEQLADPVGRRDDDHRGCLDGDRREEHRPPPGSDHTDRSDSVERMPTKTPRPSARERLLDAADELFYEQGVHTVGIDRVIERAGVAKASLYATFGSKDELIRAYLDRRHEARRQCIQASIDRAATPGDAILAIFDVLVTLFSRPGSRGCAFINAGAEVPEGSAIVEANDEYRTWVRSTFADLAADAGARDPAQLAEQLLLLYDGSAVGARMDGGADGALAARAAAATLLDAAVA
jgi:AcrR family transcriptional regulator